jgi:hypothetical protein
VILAGCGRLGFESTVDGGTPACAAVETCNGIDDTCDGLVDEGCPCTPFDVTLPFEAQRGLISTGDGLLVSTITGVVHLDASGAMDATYPGRFQTYTESKQLVGWTGREMITLDVDHVAFRALDGTARSGPPLGVMVDGPAALRWRAGGVDVLSAPAADTSTMTFTRTDADGIPVAAPASSAPFVLTSPIGIGELGGNAYGVWLEDPGTPSGAGGPLAPGIAPSGPEFAPGDNAFSDLATDGSPVFLVFANTVWSADPGGITMPAQAWPGGAPAGIAWTGAGWDVLLLDARADSYGLSRVHVDDTLAVGNASPLYTVSWMSTLVDTEPVIVADAVRTVVSFSFAADGGPFQTRIVQTCH